MLDLTASEILAKEHFMNLVLTGRDVPIDAPDGSSFSFNTPPWFDMDKFRLGQEYFLENRDGILMSNLAGLILLLTIPKGLAILRGTDRSHTPDLARNRYIDTILHTLSWYNYPLDNSTRSWDSLRRVRQMHMYASYDSMQRQLGIISQMEVSMTTFGFAGLALNRPHFYGINPAKTKKREGFLHLWAVLGYMLGIHDEYNICLLPMEAAEIEFDILMRNVFGPYLQVETKLFKEMTNAFIDGLRDFMPLLDYDSQLFLTRRAAGIPGYQYNVDKRKERPYRNIFTKEDIQKINHPLFSDKILILAVDNQQSKGKKIDNNHFSQDLDEGLSKTSYYSYTDFNYGKLIQLMGLPEDAKINITGISRNDLEDNFDDRNYNKLNMLSRVYVNVNLFFVNALGSNLGKIVIMPFVDSQISSMRKYRKKRRYS